MKLDKAFSSNRPRPKKSEIIVDNSRENIDPFVRTQVVSTKELTLSDGSAAGFVKNDANGVLSGGNAGASTVEGTDVLSTGEGGGTKFLREDGDDSCSWQTPPGANHNLLDGSTHPDTAADGVTRGSLIYGNATPAWDELTVGGAGTFLKSDGTDVAWGAHAMADHSDEGTYNISTTGTAATGALTVTGNIAVSGTVDGVDIAARDHAESHTMASHSDDDTYNINTSGTATHGALTINAVEIVGADGEVNKAAVEDSGNWDTAYTHSQDNTQAHSDYLLNSAADVGVGLTLTGDNSSADTAYVPMVLYNTDDTPPAANGFPIGTLYVQYTA